jgi:ribonuclease HI
MVHGALLQVLAGLEAQASLVSESALAEPITIYTDGACSGNPGPGGWAWASAPDGATHGSGAERPSTNQRMEVRAVLEALRAHPDRPVHIVSDSTYVVNCFRDSWYAGWIKRGWKNSQKQPVANRDLWEPLIELYLARRPAITFSWVKGHSGHPMNDLVDRLAVAAVTGPIDVPATSSRPSEGQTSLF